MSQIQAFKRLLEDQNWDEEFIGYGNPESKILIIGQEAADKEGSEGWKKFYHPNREQWIRTFHPENNFFPKNRDHISEYKFPDYFNPLFPFFQQKCTIRRCKKGSNPEIVISGKGGTSATWYWYQRLIDYVYPHKDVFVDMFEHIFITELNGHTRPNHKTKQNVEENIRHRLDIMRATSYFWRSFDVVVFACGKYKEKIESNSELLSDIFGDAHPFFCSQLSMNKAKSDIEQLGPQLKEILHK